MKQKDSEVEWEEGAVSADAAPPDTASDDAVPPNTVPPNTMPTNTMPTDVASDDTMPVGRGAFATAARRALLRIRAGLTQDRLLAAFCVATVLVLAAPWVQVPVTQLVGRNVAYSVPDLLATGQVVVDRAQTLQDLADDARQVARRAADIVERAQSVAERISNLPEGRG
ncbi:MAG: hypothetical protein RR842_00580 [Gordonibacter sp.]|uniref:hypothetical protein n=1 Tax=Gordonibacter sp. TaxID=1968902 RepID=UPI002FC67337